MNAHTYDPTCLCWQCEPTAKREALEVAHRLVSAFAPAGTVDALDTETKDVDWGNNPSARYELTMPEGMAALPDGPWPLGPESLVSQTPDFPPEDAAPGHYVELELGGPGLPPGAIGRAVTDSIYVVGPEPVEHVLTTDQALDDPPSELPHRGPVLLTNQLDPAENGVWFFDATQGKLVRERPADLLAPPPVATCGAVQFLIDEYCDRAGIPPEQRPVFVVDGNVTLERSDDAGTPVATSEDVEALMVAIAGHVASPAEDDERELSKPPPQDMRLLDYFTGNDLQPKSLHGAFEAMSATSFARAVPDPDGRLINSGAVGFAQHTENELLDRADSTQDNEPESLKSERVSRTQKHRETRAILEQLSPAHQKVLRLAYGPQDTIPLLKMTEALPVKKENNEANAEHAKRKKLETWRQVLPETSTIIEAHRAWIEDPKRKAKGMGLLQWLVDVATQKQHERTLNAAKLEAYRLVREAWNAWADLRGRRRRAEPLDQPEDLR